MLSLAYDYYLGYTFIKDGMGILVAPPRIMPTPAPPAPAMS